jgi:hypothetical protein
MYSAIHNPPTLSDTVVNVPDGTTRTGTVTGTAGTKYYYRICSLNSTGSCMVNSPVVNFTFARITLTGVSQNALTVGHITWTDSGAFPLGFGLMRSTLNIIPSYGADHFESVPGGASPLFYNFTIPQPGLTYYLDLCQVTTSGCGIYSNILIFDTDSDIILSAIDGSTAGTAALTWTLPAALPSNGYLVYRADGTDDPAISGSSIGSVTDNSLHTFDDTTIAGSGTAYSYRICAYNGSTCTEFSNKVNFTVP